MTGEILRNLESDKPGTAILDVLTGIWQRVLQRPNIGPDDEFYALGGTDALADRMFVEIAQAFGRQLPAATICHAATIAALAALLQRPDLPRFSPYVKLKAGTGKVPILITHGLGGRASFSELARHIRTEHSIYGIQAKGVDGLEQPHNSIEAMAGFYIEELRKLQPEGSHILIGYSFGGLVALEMAQRLTAEGKNIALLALVDTYPHPRYMPLGQRVTLIAKRIKGHISDLRQKNLGIAVSQVRHAVRQRLHTGDVRSPGPPVSESSRLSFAQTTLRVKQSDLVAMKHYRPRFYPGRIRFVRPETSPYLPADPNAIWKKMAAEFEVETVPGDHLGMVARHFDSLAEVLTRYVRDASAE
jgi:acetoacetyl-CoA synthetase